MTLWLIGAKPPVMKPEMESQSACRNARSGSMPMNAHRPVRMAVAMRMITTAILAMSRAVCTTLGTTCSLRPSDAYRDPAPLPKSPNESATTMSPKPPIRCIMNRHMLSALERWSRSRMMLAPVVVNPDTPSNSASR